jgi:hypothetical protein
MALSKIQPASMDLTANYAFTGTNSVAGLEYAEKKLATLTASSSATLDFTSSIDSTYNIYKFRFIDIHPQTANYEFDFQGTTDGTNYNISMTTTTFAAFHDEAGSSPALSYASGRDQANGTSFQALSHDIKADSDSSLSGELFLFDPSSTTFVKHFISDTNYMQNGDASQRALCSGYFNTTTAITGIRFQMESGNIDSGTIEMYGIN